MDAKKGDWVRIKRTVLEAEDRSENLPEDTKKVPLIMWDKGFLLDENKNIGDEVTIETYIGRKEHGALVEVNPYYKHNFGKCVPEILYIGRQAKEILEKEGVSDE